MTTKKTASKSTGKEIVPTKGFNEMVEIVKADESVAEAGLAKYTAAPSFDASDLYVPRLRLAQGLTAEVQDGSAKPGEWLVLGTDPMKAVTVVPMMMVRRRELRDNDDTQRPVVCRSADSIHGVGVPGGECAACDMNKWLPGKKGSNKNQAPLCVFIYSYIVFVVDLGDLAVLEFSRTSIATGKMLNTMIMQKGLGNFAVKLTSTSSTGPRGTYYSPSLAGIKVDDKVLKAAASKVSTVF